MISTKVVEATARRVEAGGTHYEVLGIKPGVAPSEVLKAHRALAGLFHPDRCKRGNSHDLTARINVAYTTLIDPEARRKYDFANRIKAETCPTCKGNGFVLKQKGFNKKESTTCPKCTGTGAKL